MAFAALGAAEIIGRWPGDPGALSLLAIAGTVIGDPAADAAWPWPAPRLSVTWLLGGNDAGIPMFDERTGGCSDALSRTSRSRNQGAESTLARHAAQRLAEYRQRHQSVTSGIRA
jgi:hypothetical protein